MFRFTIRDVLWLTALAAVLLAWWVDHRRADRRERIARDNWLTYTNFVEGDLFQPDYRPEPLPPATWPPTLNRP